MQLVIGFVIQRNRQFQHFCSLSVSIKSDINYWLFRCLLTACFDNILHTEEQQTYIYSCLPVLIFQDGSYFKSIFVEHYQNLQFSLQLLSVKVQCQLSVVMQTTPVSLYKLCSGTNRRLSNNYAQAQVADKPMEKVRAQ